jgi:hypothetical protein
MSKRNDATPTYACMTPTSDLRRVHEPHDERIASKRSHRVRSALAKVVAAIRP